MKIVTKFFYIVFVLVLLAVASLFLASLLPIPGNVKIKIVKSGSMEPAIKTGSIVIVRSETSYAVGDVITFGQDNKVHIPTTHRIVEIKNDTGKVTYIVKGDANEEADPTEVMPNTVIGRVLLSVPYAGYVLDFARQPIGFTLLIGIPAGIIILDETLRIYTEVVVMRRKRSPQPRSVVETNVIDLRNRKII